MSVNKYIPHLYVLPEDRGDEQIANGFANHPGVSPRQIQVVEPAGGWHKVRETFLDEYVPLLRQYANAHIVMVIDFDGDYSDRRARFEAETPEELRSRVFVVGPRNEPEDLKRSVGRRLEEIGRTLAEDCDLGTVEFWHHAELQHNGPDRIRMEQIVRPFLFQ